MVEFTAEYLQEHYVKQQKSPAIIARETGSYPNAVRRALEGFGIPLRGRAEAQKIALAQQHKAHPTQGKPRSEATKDKIRGKIKAIWGLYRKSYRTKCLQKMRKNNRRKLTKPTRLEQELLKILQSHGWEIKARHEGIDLFLPNEKVCICIDGHHYYKPIRGLDVLITHIVRAELRNDKWLGQGYCVIVVKCLERFRTIATASLAQQLVELIKSPQNTLFHLEYQSR